jgi:hypothetical protein
MKPGTRVAFGYSARGLYCLEIRVRHADGHADLEGIQCFPSKPAALIYAKSIGARFTC